MADVDSPDYSDAESDPLQSTADIIEAARRPLIVGRHKAAINEALAEVGDALIAEVEVNDPSVLELITAIADDDSLHNSPFNEGLLEHACMARENGELSDDSLQLFLARAYRHVHDLLSKHQAGRQIALDDLQTLPCGRINRLQNPLEDWGFGQLSLADGLVYTASQGERARASARLITRAEGADEYWQEAAGEPSISRELEEPLEQLPEEERKRARLHLVRDRIRHRFFKKVFLVYFDRDTLDPDEIAAHPTIIDWLEAIADTPHLFPFMQGQTQGQKIFRLRQLWRKLLQLNELYQRVAQASQHPTYRERFADLGTRERLSMLAADRYPALKVDTAFSITTALCPFQQFAQWIQDKVQHKDFVLPPEPKRPL